MFLQLYFEIIEKDDEEQMEYIGVIINELYYPIKFFLDRIKRGEKLSESEIKTLKIILFAPIIGNNKNSFAKKLRLSFEEVTTNKNNNEKINVQSNSKKEAELIINYTEKNVSDGKIMNYKAKITNPDLYNINYLKEDIYGPKLRTNLTKIDLLKYVKIQYFQENNFYTHNKVYWDFNTGIIKYILKSTTIETLFKSLYPDKSFIFNEEKNIK